MKTLLAFGTIDLHEVQLVLGLAAKPDVSIHVMCNTNCPNSQRLVAAGVDVEHLDCRNKLDRSAIKQLKKKLASGKCDIVQTFTSRILANTLWAVRGLPQPPKVVSFRGVMGRLSRFDPATWLTYLNPRLAAVSCISEAARQGLIDSRVRAKLRTIHLGLDESWFADYHQPSLTNCGIPAGAFTVGCVANIRPVKGIDLLLRSALDLVKHREIHWVLVGEVRDKQVQRLAADPRLAGRVHPLGFREDGAELAGSFDVFVMPSRQEGLSKSLMEAMAQGVCPVITDVGGMPELVRHERDGLVVPKENVPALTAAIEALYHNAQLRHNLSESARQRILRDFSTQKMIDETYRFHQELLDNTTRRAA